MMSCYNVCNACQLLNYTSREDRKAMFTFCSIATSLWKSCWSSAPTTTQTAENTTTKCLPGAWDARKSRWGTLSLALPFTLSFTLSLSFTILHFYLLFNRHIVVNHGETCMVKMIRLKNIVVWDHIHVFPTDSQNCPFFHPLLES